MLSLGIVTSMFTAIVGSRALIHLIWGRKRKLERALDRDGVLTMEFFRKKTSYPFMATRKRWYAVSAVLIARLAARRSASAASTSASTSPAASCSS